MSSTKTFGEFMKVCLEIGTPKSEIERLLTACRNSRESTVRLLAYLLPRRWKHQDIPRFVKDVTTYLKRQSDPAVNWVDVAINYAELKNATPTHSLLDQLLKAETATLLHQRIPQVQWAGSLDDRIMAIKYYLHMHPPIHKHAGPRPKGGFKLSARGYGAKVVRYAKHYSRDDED